MSCTTVSRDSGEFSTTTTLSLWSLKCANELLHGHLLKGLCALPAHDYQYMLVARLDRQVLSALLMLLLECDAALKRQLHAMRLFLQDIFHAIS